VTRGKEELVLIRPYQNGLLLYTMFYTNGIRDFNQVRKGETARVSEEENRLALGLIDQMASEEFAPDTYRDEHRERVLAFLQEKGKVSS
jgi:DNA end-binding protein Ku